MKMAKKIQKAKDIKEVIYGIFPTRFQYMYILSAVQVERDLALIKSPAAGLRQAMKAKQQEEMEEEEGEMEMAEVDTSLNLAKSKK